MKLAVKDMSRKAILLTLIVLLGASAVCFCEEITLTTIMPASSSSSSNVKVASSNGTPSPSEIPIDLSVAPYNFDPAKPWHVILGDPSSGAVAYYYGSRCSYTKSDDNKSFTIHAATFQSGFAEMTVSVDWLAIQVQ